MKIEEKYIKLILFFYINDIFSLNTIKLISYYFKETEDLFDFFPTLENHIYKKRNFNYITNN